MTDLCILHKEPLYSNGVCPRCVDGGLDGAGGVLFPTCVTSSTDSIGQAVVCSGCGLTQKLALEPLEMYSAGGALFCSKKCRDSSQTHRIAVLNEHIEWLVERDRLLPPGTALHGAYSAAMSRATKHILELEEGGTDKPKDERQEFEAWVELCGMFTDWTWTGDAYAKPRTQTAWLAWQARAAQ